MTETAKELFRQLPGVDSLLLLIDAAPGMEQVPKSVRTRAVRSVIDTARSAIAKGDLTKPDALRPECLVPHALALIAEDTRPNLRRTINATGVVVHTNLGRSLLSRAALRRVEEMAGGFSNLEFNLATGKRGLRYSAVEELICEITGAEAAMVVNNNAAAVLLCLDTVARGKEVIVSRGELVEIGGSFRIPDVMAKSGAILKEVGTTNRTHLKDYRNAVTPETGLLLKVHTSNFSVVGFTKSVPMEEMVALGRTLGLPVMDDLGSGTFVDFSRYGLAKEPTVQESVSAGADLVTFSGDKLLGGPQAGIIAGSARWIREIRSNPLTRALRIDKMTLAALEATLRLYRDPEQAIREIPTLRMITMTETACARRAEELKDRLVALGLPGFEIRCIPAASRAGGGSLPILDLPSRCVAIRPDGITAAGLERFLREYETPIIGRIEADCFLMDVRTLQEGETDRIITAFTTLITRLAADAKPGKDGT